MIGGLALAVAYQSSSVFKEAILNSNYDLDGHIDSFENLDLEDIPLKLGDISIDSNLTVNFGIIIAVNIVTENNNTIPIPFFGLDDNLLTRLNISDSNSIVTGMDQNMINVSSVEDISKNHQISINKNESIVDDWLFSRIIKSTNHFYHLQLDSYSYNYEKYYLIGNHSCCIQVAKELELNASNVGSIFYGFIDESILEISSPEEVIDLVDLYVKDLYLEFIRIGTNPDCIDINTSINNVIHNALVAVYNDIYDIQWLSIPNIVLIFLLIFTMDVGVMGILKNLRKKLWLKGFSDRKINTIFFVIEVIPDLAAFLLSLLLMFILGRILGITNLLDFTFVRTLIQTFVIIFLCKVINFFFLNRPKKKTDTIRESTSNESSNKPLKIVKITSFTLLLLVVFMQISRIFTPLFWFPVIDGTTEIIFDVFTAIIFLLNIVILFTPRFEGKPIFSKQNELRTLFKRLFASEKKRIVAQQVTIFIFYLLLTFMIVDYQAMNAYSDKPENLFDVELHIIASPGTGIELSQIQNVTTALPEIKNVSVEDFFGSTVVFDLKQSDAGIHAINTSIYSEKDLYWNHFIGAGGNSNKDILSSMNNRTIILNQKLAKELGARVGDNITLNAEDFPAGNDTNYIDVIIANLEVIGIYDSLLEFSDLDLCAVVDFTLLDDLRTSLNLSRCVQNIKFDLHYETDNETLIQILQSETLDSFEKLLDLDVNYLLEINSVSSYVAPEAEEFSLYNDTYASFVWFEVVFGVIFLSMITLVFNNKILSSLNSKFHILGSRGFDDKLLRKDYRKDVFSSIITGNILGIVIGLIISFLKLSYGLPILFLIGNYSILIEVAILILLSIVVVFGTLGMLQINLNKNLKTLKNGGKEK